MTQTKAPVQDAAAAIHQAAEEALALDAPLDARLDHFSACLATAAPAYAVEYDRLIARLKAVRAGRRAPKAGKAMPEVVLPDEAERLVRLSELLAAGPVVLSFNRGHWCDYCRIELSALAAIDPEVRQLGGRIVAVLPDTAADLSRLRQDDRIPFLLLRDADCSLALSLGLAVAIDDRLAGMLRADGIDLAAFHGGAGRLLPIPATLVIAASGTVILAQADPDFRKRLPTGEILQALRGLQ